MGPGVQAADAADSGSSGLNFGTPEVVEGVLMVTPASVLSKYMPTLELMDMVKFKVPMGIAVASPVLNLKPEGVTFEKPVRLLVPTHVGANAAWRSRSDGSWEQVPAQFREGYMELYLSHFCQVFSSRPASDFSIKAVAFLNPGSSQEAPQSKVAFLEADCPTCEQELHHQVAGLVRSGEEAVDLFGLGEINILHGEVAQIFHMDFGSRVQISQAFQVPFDTLTTHQLHVDMRVIEPDTGRTHFRHYTFEFPHGSTSSFPENVLLTQHVPILQNQTAVSLYPPLPPPPDMPVPPDRPNPPRISPDPPPVPPHQAPDPPPVAPHQAPDPPPVPPVAPDPEIPRPPAPPQPRRHLMLSGRFNTPERFEYIRRVQEALENRGVETFLVNVGGGQRFNFPTMEGLVNMRKMAAFCEWDYGAFTGAAYETFHELSYAWEEQIPIIPVKYCQTWPPMPPDRAGQIQNAYIFRRSLVYIDAVAKSIDEIADAITEAWSL